MRRFFIIASVALAFVIAGVVSAQVRGRGRVQGIVVDKESGKPVEGAKVVVAPSDGSTSSIDTKTNAKGRWSALGLTSGLWNIDITKEGYQTSRGTANVSELQLMPPIKTELAPEVKEEESAVATEPSIPQEAIDAVNKGQELMKEEKYAEAVTELEKALTFLPDNEQLKQVLAQAYYKAGSIEKAIALLEGVHAADPTNNGVALLLTNLYLENGRLDEGRAMLATLPVNSIVDPTVYINIGILFLNKDNPAEGLVYFGKAVALDETKAESYYYRGLAEVQLKKTAEAKADFEKVVALAPESSEAHDAKQILEGLK